MTSYLKTCHKGPIITYEKKFKWSIFNSIVIGLWSRIGYLKSEIASEKIWQCSMRIASGKMGRQLSSLVCAEVRISWSNTKPKDLQHKFKFKVKENTPRLDSLLKRALVAHSGVDIVDEELNSP